MIDLIVQELKKKALQFSQSEREQQDYFRGEVKILLEKLELIARKEVAMANRSSRINVDLLDHPIYSAVVEFKRRVNV